MIEKIALVGMMGAGKSEAGRIAAARLRLPFIDLDARIEAAEGSRVAALFAERGEAAFRRLETLHLSIVCRERKGVLASGGGAVLAAENRETLRRWGMTIYLRARPETLAARLAAGGANHRPLLAGAEPVARLASILSARARFYEEADLVLDTDGLTPAETAERIVRAAGAPDR